MIVCECIQSFQQSRIWFACTGLHPSDSVLKQTFTDTYCTVCLVMGGLFVTMFLALCFGAVVAKSTCSGSTCPDAAKGGNLLQAKRSTVLTQNEGSAFDPEVPHGGPGGRLRPSGRNLFYIDIVQGWNYGQLSLLNVAEGVPSKDSL